MSTFQACILKQAVELLYRINEQKNQSVHSMPCHDVRITAIFVIPFICILLIVCIFNVQYIQLRLLRRHLRLGDCDRHCQFHCQFHCQCVVSVADAMYRDIILAVPFVMCKSPMSTFFDLIKRCQKTVKYLSQL